jgi:hypothetical protein
MIVPCNMDDCIPYCSEATLQADEMADAKPGILQGARRVVDLANIYQARSHGAIF